LAAILLRNLNHASVKVGRNISINEKDAGLMQQILAAYVLYRWK